MVKYYPNKAGLLQFDINVDVKVYSKEAGNRNDLWGVEVYLKFINISSVCCNYYCLNFYIYISNNSENQLLICI